MQCTAQGTQNLQPAMSPEAACEDFAAALEAAMQQGGRSPETFQSLTAALSFSSAGIARVEMRQSGQSAPMFDANVARTDRPLDHAVIERLAMQVAQRLANR